MLSPSSAPSHNDVRYIVTSTAGDMRYSKLPVTLLSGFLGAGKSTLLRKILETKHGDSSFKCAVLVNDVAELNIDQKLIESTGLIQSDAVVSMQNGCICCSLSGDLVNQIATIAEKSSFDYIHDHRSVWGI